MKDIELNTDAFVISPQIFVGFFAVFSGNVRGVRIQFGEQMLDSVFHQDIGFNIIDIFTFHQAQHFTEFLDIISSVAGGGPSHEVGAHQ